MSSIYRVRPANKSTLDELTNSYLWFSKPNGFKGDAKDANIGAFVTDTAAIKRGIDFYFEMLGIKFPYEEWYEKMSHTGICCFTSKLPNRKRIKKFPKCSQRNCICIEYNKDIIESFFLNHKHYPIVPCFIPVVYDNNPTKIEAFDEWSILWERTPEGSLYKTIPGILHEHPRECDLFLRKLLTRLNSKFKFQKEERIILGGGNIPSYDKSILGYKIEIPMESIIKIYVYPNVSHKFKEHLMSIDGIKNKIQII